MTLHRRQAFVDAPLAVVWELVGDPGRHPSWWPRVLEVSGERFEEGANYAQVTRNPFGARLHTRMQIDHLDDMHEIEMSCQTTGTRARWLLTEAEGGTFVEVELGLDPRSIGSRLFDSLLGPAYFRRWTERSLAGLRAAGEDAARERASGRPAAEG